MEYHSNTFSVEIIDEVDEHGYKFPDTLLGD